MSIPVTVKSHTEVINDIPSFSVSLGYIINNKNEYAAWKLVSFSRELSFLG